MDVEQRFLYALLSSNRNEQEKFYIQQIPRGVFKLREPEISWLYRFRDKHGVYPSLKLFNQKFSEEPLKKHKDSLSASLQPILDMAMFSQMRDLTNEVKEKLDNAIPVTDALNFFKDSASKISSFSVDYVDVNHANTDGSIRRYKKLIKDIAEGGANLLDTPWPSLNKMVKYFRGGDTAVIAARTSIGKTWITLEWTDHYAKKGIDTLYISKEMPTEQVSDRHECKRFKLPYDAFRGGELQPEDLARWFKARKKAKGEKYPLIISGEETIEGVGLEHVVAKINQYKPRVCFIDGAYLIFPKGISSNAKQHERLAYLSNRLKAIAKATNTFIVIVIQMNRNAEKKDGTTKGTIADLYGSDAWAQDADAVLDISGKRGSNMRTISLLKGRESSIGEFNIKFLLDPWPIHREIKTIPIRGKAVRGRIAFKGVK